MSMLVIFLIVWLITIFLNAGLVKLISKHARFDYDDRYAIKLLSLIPGLAFVPFFAMLIIIIVLYITIAYNKLTRFIVKQKSLNKIINWYNKMFGDV